MPPAAGDHGGGERVREHDRRAQVDVEGAVDLLDGEGLQGPGGGQGGVGDEDVDVAGVRREALDGGALAEVDRQRARAELGGERLEHVGAPSGQDQRGAACAQRPCDRVADAAGGAGEQHGGAGDLHDL